MYYLGSTSLEVSTLWLTFLTVLYRLSFGCVHTPVTSMVLKTLPSDRPSMGSGLDGIHRGLASAFGIEPGSTVLQYRTLVHLIGLGQGREVSTLSVQETAATVTQLLMQAGDLGGMPGGKALAILREHLRQRAQLAAYQDTFLLLCAVPLWALLAALLSQASRKRFTMQMK